MKQIKVLHVIRDMGPGGAERVVINYMKNHDRSIFEPIVCILNRLFPEEKKEMEEKGISYIHLKKKLGWDTKALFSLVSLIKNEKVDILHLHNFSAALYGTIAGVLSKNCPIIFRTEHNIYHPSGNMLSRIKRLANYFLGAFHKNIIAVSNEVKRTHTDHCKFFKNKYVTIYNGIEESEFDKSSNYEKFRQEFGFEKDSIVIGKIGSMYPQKAHEVLFEAAKLVLNAVPEARFLLVGDGPRRSELQAMVSNIGLENEITFTGLRSDVPDLLHFIDIFVLSSAWEGFPMTILEAMASGTPVVVTDVGGNSEAVIHGETGYLVTQGDYQALACAIIELADNYQKRVSMGKAGKNRLLNNFTSEVMVRSIEELYLKNLK